MPVPLRDALQASLGDALRARDPVRTSVLRSTLSAIANAEAVEVPASTTATEAPRRLLTEGDVRAIVVAEHAELVTVAAQLRTLGRDGAAADLDAKAAVLAAELVMHAP